MLSRTSGGDAAFGTWKGWVVRKPGWAEGGPCAGGKRLGPSFFHWLASDLGHATSYALVPGVAEPGRPQLC